MKCHIFLPMFLLASSQLVQANNLPFIGEIYDSPNGGYSYHITFTITPNGKLSISSCGTTSCGMEYDGDYTQRITTQYGGYLFENNKIYYTDVNGKKIRANANDCYAHLKEGNMYCEVNTDLPHTPELPQTNEEAHSLGLPFLGRVIYTTSANNLVSITFYLHRNKTLTIEECTYQECNIVFNGQYSVYIPTKKYGYLFENNNVYLTDLNTKQKIRPNNHDCFSNINSKDDYCLQDTSNPNMDTLTH